MMNSKLIYLISYSFVKKDTLKNMSSKIKYGNAFNKKIGFVSDDDAATDYGKLRPKVLFYTSLFKVFFYINAE